MTTCHLFDPPQEAPKPRTTVESQLFDWTGGWDQFDTAGFTFYNVTTKIQIGPIAAGLVFDYANVDYENSKIEFGNDGGETFSFALLISVGEQL